MSRADERAEKRRKVSGKEKRGEEERRGEGRAQLGADGDFAGKE